MASLSEITYMARILPSTKSIMLRGPHGCGKTEWTQNCLGKALGLEKVVVWHPSHAADTGDVTGLPDKQKLADGTIVTKFCPPDWMTQSEPVLLIIDEANRGLAMVQNAIMQLTASGTYGSTSLPNGSRIIGLINPDLEEGDVTYDVGSMDPAQQDRFVYMDFEPTIQEWLEYAAQARLNQRVIDYITDHPEQLDFNGFREKELVKGALNSKSKRMPSRRSWNGVANMLDNAEKDGALNDQFKRKCVLLAIAGLVGDSNAANFSEYLKAGRALSAEMVLLADTFDLNWVDAFKQMSVPNAMNFYRASSIFLKGKEADMDAAPDETKLIADNFCKLMMSFAPDIQRNIVQNEISVAMSKGHEWIKKLIAAQPEIKQWYINALMMAKNNG